MRSKIALALLCAPLYVFAQPPDFTPPTPLFGAVMSNDTTSVKKLLAEGAKPDEGRIAGIPALFFAISRHNFEMIDALVDGGADVNVTDRNGNTTLMIATLDETGDDNLVKRLLKLKVDPNAKNNSGETALQWAMRRGLTPAVEALRNGGASDAEMIRESVEKAVGLLQKSAPEFVKVSGCTSCHHQSLPQMAVSVARRRGIVVDETVAQKQVKTVMGMFRPATELMAKGTRALPDPPIVIGYSLAGLAAEGYAGDETTAAMAHLVSTYQQPDGSFGIVAMRPPIESSEISGAALGLRALQLYGKDADVNERIERARRYLENAKPVTGEDYSMRLLGLAWAKAPAAMIRQAAEQLVARQRSDGGWAQLDRLDSDAYATGMAMYALQTSRQARTMDPVYQRGVVYLLRTQLDDGSWLVRTRTIPLQPYRESGFPHGRHQWISAAGTSWAAMALGLTQPEVSRSMQPTMPGGDE